MDPKAILLRVLTIIDYKDDKNAFAENYIKAIAELTIAQMIGTLAPERKKQLDIELTDVKDSDIFQEITRKYFPREAFEKQLGQVSQETFTNYIETIYPTLSPEKQEELTTYLSTLPKPDNVL